MPTLSRAFIKSGLLFFAAALLLWVAIIGRAFFGLPSFLGAMMPSFFHLLMVGWITQIIFGVSIWMFPAQTRENPRGSGKLGWTCFYLLNFGLLMRLIGEPAVLATGSAALGAVLLFSGFFQLLAGAAYVKLIWSRVKGK